MNFNLIQNKKIFRLIGGFIFLTSVYLLIKSGYFCIYHDSSGGLEDGVFSYPRNLSEVIIVFSFWLIILIGGIGLIRVNRIGLIISMFIGIISSLISLALLTFTLIHKLKYSTSISINGIEKEMTLIEKWEYIYSELFLYLAIFIFIILVLILIIKRLKYVKKHQTTTQK